MKPGRGLDAAFSRVANGESGSGDVETVPLNGLVEREAEVSREFGLNIDAADLQKEKSELARIVAGVGGLGAIAKGDWDQMRRLIVEQFSKAMAEESTRYFERIKRTRETSSNLAYNIHLESVVAALMRKAQELQ